MTTFANAKTTDEAVTKDTVGGGFMVESGLYDMMIEMAYSDTTASGAKSLTLHLRDVSSNALVRLTTYPISGDSKGNKTTYTDKKTGKEFVLADFALATSLAQVVAGMNLEDLTETEKVVKRWDKDTKGELSQKTNVLNELINQPVKVGMIKQVVDKTALGDNGYAPTGETREENKADRFFRAADSLSQTEIKASATEAVFIHKWADKWTGVTKQLAKHAGSSGATAGTPKAAAAPEADAAVNANLFG